MPATAPETTADTRRGNRVLTGAAVLLLASATGLGYIAVGGHAGPWQDEINALGGTSQEVVMPMPERTFDDTAPDTWAGDVPAPEDVATGPFRVAVPSQGIDVAWSPASAANGSLTIPPAPAAAWYDQSAPIGAPIGTSIVASHVNFDSLALAPFAELAGLEKGEPIYATDSHGVTHRYKVDSLQVHHQTALPDEIFTRVGDPTLALVTCSGRWITTADQGFYEYNLIVTATLA